MKAGSAPARFGANGLADGATREQGTNTTPTGLYDLPYAFGIRPAPRGTAYRYRPVRQDSLVVPGQRLRCLQPLDRTTPRRLPRRRGQST